MKPLLAHIYEPHRWNLRRGCYIQRKYDGVRGLNQAGTMQSRDGGFWNANVLQHILKPLSEIVPKDWVLDGELYRHGWQLQKINSAVNIALREPYPETSEVGYYIFDLPRIGLSFRDRFALLQKLAPQFENLPIHIAPTQYVTTHEEADAFYIEAVTAGYEGIMYRINDCPYTIPRQLVTSTTLIGNTNSSFLSDKQNRTFHLLKRKDWQDGEFICRGITEGDGKRSGMVGRFICENSSGRPFKVGTGLDDGDWEKYFRDPPIGRPIKIKYRCLTVDKIPFNPIILAIL